MLAEHPEVLDKLRQEIFSRVGPAQQPTFEDFREMKYLRAVLNGKYLFFMDDVRTSVNLLFQKLSASSLPCM